MVNEDLPVLKSDAVAYLGVFGYVLPTDNFDGEGICNHVDDGIIDAIKCQCTIFSKFKIESGVSKMFDTLSLEGMGMDIFATDNSFNLEINEVK